MEMQERPPTRTNSKKETNEENNKEVDTENPGDPNAITILRKVRFGPFRQGMRCPYCNGKMATRIESIATPQTHMMAALLALMCLWPCVPVVYSHRGFLRHKHYCSICDKLLGQNTFWSCFKRTKFPKYERRQAVGTFN